MNPKIYIFIVFLISIYQTTFAQDITVSGKVLDKPNNVPSGLAIPKPWSVYKQIRLNLLR